MTVQCAARVALAIVACATAGCQDPYAGNRSAASQPSRSTVEPTATTPTRSASPAARAFATRWVNWSWRSVAVQQRALARLATGSLTAQLRADARSAARDASLARDRPGGRGWVAAASIRARGKGATGLVVTREEAYTAGHADLGGARYRVYLIELRREPGGWKVSAWAPQP